MKNNESDRSEEKQSLSTVYQPATNCHSGLQQHLEKLLRAQN